MITDLYIHSADGLTPASMRPVSISRLEAELRMAAVPGAVLAEHAPALAAIYGAAHPAGSDIPEPSLAQLRARKPTIKKLEPRPPLGSRRPSTTGDNDDFYRDVALAYAEYAPQTRAPAKAIAEEAHAPKTSAQRWIAEARRRGFLPQTTKGKVG